MATQAPSDREALRSAPAIHGERQLDPGHGARDHRRDPARAAPRSLRVHENTVKNHLRSAADLRGRPADDRIAETLVALRRARVVHGPRQ